MKIFYSHFFPTTPQVNIDVKFLFFEACCFFYCLKIEINNFFLIENFFLNI